MSRPVLILRPTPLATRVLLRRGQRDLLRAELPPPAQTHPRAAATLLEGLSLWLQERLSAVLYADARGCSSALGLCDGFGFGEHTDHYEVEVLVPGRRHGLGSFRDLRQLAVRGEP